MTDTSARPTERTIAGLIERILREFRDTPPAIGWGRKHALWSTFKTLGGALEQLGPVKARAATLLVEPSGGQGRKARVPWVALMDSRDPSGQTRSTQRGVYVVFLFREDMSGVYLTLAQGVTEPRKQLSDAEFQRLIRDRVGVLRSNAQETEARQFRLDDGVELRGTEQLAKDYEASVAAYRFYDAQGLPNDEELSADLETILHAYDRYLESGTGTPMGFPGREPLDRADAALEARQPAHLEGRTWIFQANPAYFDLRGVLAELPEIGWLVKQHAADIHAGDTVYLWEVGRRAALLAVATVLAEPSILENRPEERKFMRDPSRFEGPQLRVRVRVDRVLPDPLPREVLLNHPIVGGMSFFPRFQGTNYGVAAEYVPALRELVQGTTSPPVIRGRPVLTVSAGRFKRLLRDLEAQGLFFPSELVGNYLLALQSKRFVILTGISGTGKTQLAMSIARAFRPTVRVAKPTGAVKKTVEEYMLRYHRFILPAELRSQMRLSPGDALKERQLEVLYPSGRAMLSFNPSANDTLHALTVLFSGEFRRWFDETFQVGETFYLDIEPAESEGFDRLRIAPPAEDTEEQPLDNLRVIAVRPDWTDNRGLLGYFNPLTEEYVGTRFLDLLLEAQREVDVAYREERFPHPFFAVLDEMNLARVEYYFSDFLSSLESGEPLDLDRPSLDAGPAGASASHLTVPENIFFTGTVNIDETTSMFSPKVLDRAFTIEVNQVELSAFGQSPAASSGASPLALHQLPDQLVYSGRPTVNDWRAFGKLLDAKLREVVVALHDLLEPDQRHFGFRVANEIARYVVLASEQAGNNEDVLWAALDLALLEKVLPKFHGTQQELEETLQSLFAFALTVSAVAPQADAPTNWRTWRPVAGVLAHNGVDDEASSRPRLPRMAAKVWRMLRRLDLQGFTAFVE